ncbi:MAG TPA: hypothetical protein VFP61_00580 [Acidimicrobiales bacterium]|nr:hypothetical protein [Acidimicrobiales bacterium]
MVIGAVLIAIAVFVVLPALFWVGAFAISWGLSGALTHHADETHAGSELIATNI